MSDFDLEGRARPEVVRSVVDDERSEVSVELKARLVEEEISFVIFLGLRIPYKPVSEVIFDRCVFRGWRCEVVE